jgi:hypothetical protein
MATQTEGGKIEFVEYHQPGLADGDYTLTVSQSIKAQKQDLDDKFESTLHFSVLGPRFTLDPQVIASVFPPPGSVGDHSNGLPHIALHRTTLPWERTAIRKDDSGRLKKEKKQLPWLVLLVIDEDELAARAAAQDGSKATVNAVTAGKLRTPAAAPIEWPGIASENGQDDSDAVSVVDVPWGLLRQIIPGGDDLRLLSHVRKTQESSGKPGEDELAVVLGARLPKPGCVSHAHLVSVEGRYKYEGDRIVFHHQGAQDRDLIRLVSLKSWRFSCLDPKHSFSGLLSHLDRSSGLQLPNLEPTRYADPAAVDVARKHLAMGCVPLPHAMRQGNKTVSWYRGPLVPGKNATEEFPLPTRTADALVYYDEAYGMFDVSYAAAWELGRLLALQSKSFAISLYHWKRSHARSLKDADTQLTHLPFDGPSADLELPEAVSNWFEHLLLLEGVPFRYLVPDERMLPAESIRFFQVDPIWIECLVDGAFSIGRVLPSDHEQDRSHKKSHIDPLLPEQVSGVLIRSDVVAGWPGLQVEGYDEPIYHDRFVPENEPSFELKPADCVPDLNSKRISPTLEEKFHERSIAIAKERCTVENRQWLITRNDQQQFMLIKRENNQIDVCTAADAQFLFSIEAGYETDLNHGKASSGLLQAFTEQKQALAQDIRISVSSWFITDNEHQTHHLVQREGDRVKVYRYRELPLLRMDRLSANVLICLFEGIVQTVDVHLRPDTLHCGVQSADDKGVHKKLWSGEPIDLAWREGGKRTVNIGALAGEIQKKRTAQTFSSAEFAWEMIEGAEKVRFCAQSNGATT